MSVPDNINQSFFRFIVTTINISNLLLFKSRIIELWFTDFIRYYVFIEHNISYTWGIVIIMKNFNTSHLIVQHNENIR